jgi:hypothetical protein
MRIPFGLLFKIVDGWIIAKRDVLINDVIVTAGETLDPHLTNSGIEIEKLTNCDIEYEVNTGLFVIVGFYPPENLPFKEMLIVALCLALLYSPPLIV